MFGDDLPDDAAVFDVVFVVSKAVRAFTLEVEGGMAQNTVCSTRILVLVQVELAAADAAFGDSFHDDAFLNNFYLLITLY